jgi:hypothetical protein
LGTHRVRRARHSIEGNFGDAPRSADEAIFPLNGLSVAIGISLEFPSGEGWRHSPTGWLGVRRTTIYVCRLQSPLPPRHLRCHPSAEGNFGDAPRSADEQPPRYCVPPIHGGEFWGRTAFGGRGNHPGTNVPPLHGGEFFTVNRRLRLPFADSLRERTLIKSPAKSGKASAKNEVFCKRSADLRLAGKTP